MGLWHATQPQAVTGRADRETAPENRGKNRAATLLERESLFVGTDDELPGPTIVSR